MIDELVKVADAMQSAGILAKDWHPKLKTLPKVSKKAPCVRIWLTAEGRIKDVESLSEEQVKHLRKYEPDNGKSLPGFNVRPLYRLAKSEDERKKIVKEVEAALKKGSFDWGSFTCQEDDFWAKTRDGLERCFGAVREDLGKVCDGNLTEGETLQKFLEAVSRINVAQFQTEYSDAVRRKIETGELPLSLMCYFVTEAQKCKEDADSRVMVPKFSIVLDIAEYKDYPVAHSETIGRLNALLMKDDEKSDHSTSENEEKDAYGLDACQKDEKFPGVALSFLGNVILRSQVETVRAQWRYNRCESDTFPVGSATRRRTKAALEWIASPERDGETYGIAGDKELLFAYPRVLPKDKIPLAKLFGAQPDENLKADKFERLAKRVIEQLNGLGRSAADAELEVFSLRKMDKARTKVVYYRNATVASLERASVAWYEGCQNIPSLDVRDWSETKDEKTGKSHPVPVQCETVFPVKLHRYLNTVWKRDGEQAGKVKIFEPADGLRLLLEEPCAALASHMMERFMQHAQGCFLTLCRSVGKYEVAKLPDKIYYPGILGLLLFKSGKRKDEYMNESAVQLGRCLRVADEIHRLYCEVVRKKDLPSELCGSSLLVSMMESPSMTLSQLAMRSAPYVKWARSFHDAEKGGLVHYWMRQWSEIANPLLEKGWPKRLTPDERAQVFLGYLSSFTKSANASNQTDSNNNQGEEK
jgi:hypothetical protein